MVANSNTSYELKSIVTKKFNEIVVPQLQHPESCPISHFYGIFVIFFKYIHDKRWIILFS